MAFNKVFVILALVSCALAMPVQPIDGEPASTSVSTKVDIQDSGVSRTIAIDEERATTNPIVAPLDQEIVKRSIEEADSEDLDTAAGTNVLRPLFVYRQQVAYRQRIKNSKRGKRVN